MSHASHWASPLRCPLQVFCEAKSETKSGEIEAQVFIGPIKIDTEKDSYCKVGGRFHFLELKISAQWAHRWSVSCR